MNNSSNKVIEFNLNSAEAYCKRGNTYKNEANFDQAIADYTEALKLDPN